MRKLLIVVIILAVVGAGYLGYMQYQRSQEIKKISNFDECVAAGFAAMASYPGRCVTSDGRSFTQEIGNELELTDVITISNPRPNQTIKAPITITGQARGSWYFEASFPVELFDANNKSLGKGSAQADGEWMTEDFVPFTLDFDFDKPSTKTGRLILHNANPSGLPENDKELIIPVTF